MHKFRFVDLFAGIGGFHLALKSLGGKCVFSSEINKQCRSVYLNNFPSSKKYLKGDITKIEASEIPDFDVLCAGFPCQSFSKAGLRLGFQDGKRGNLFDNVIRILKYHKECGFIILENVKNLADNRSFWEYIQLRLSELDFFVTKEPIVLSPTDFDVPQNRDRVYILGVRKAIASQSIRDKGEITVDALNLRCRTNIKMGSAFEILDTEPDIRTAVPPRLEKLLNAWDEFKLNILVESIEAPIWMKYFGRGISGDVIYDMQIGLSSMPQWKKRIVKRNRDFYLSKKDAIEEWIKKWGMDSSDFTNVDRKFEWNCKEDCQSLKDGIIQVRHSGIRVKRPTYYPALVAIGNTPIVWSDKLGHFRYLSVRECSRLQSFPEDYIFGDSDEISFRQLGNSVNVKVVKSVTKGLLKLVLNGGTEHAGRSEDD